MSPPHADLAGIREPRAYRCANEDSTRSRTIPLACPICGYEWRINSNRVVRKYEAILLDALGPDWMSQGEILESCEGLGLLWAIWRRCEDCAVWASVAIPRPADPAFPHPWPIRAAIINLYALGHLEKEPHALGSPSRWRLAASPALKAGEARA